MRIDSDVAHVSFSYNTGNPDVDLHFNYSFTCMEESTTAVPTTVITTPAPPSSNYYTFAAINCIRPHIDEASRLEPAVKQKLALIATMYAEENNLMLDQNITDDQIAIYNEKKCNPVQCNVDKCVAFNYSILYLDEEGKWVFTKEMMDTMVLDHSVEFADIEEGRGCERDNQICIEDPEVSILPYILLSVVVVVIGCIISFIVYRAGRGAVVKENRTKYNKENEERIDDERRRSSGNISMLGLGNNRGSIGSVASSKRFSMPFPTKDRKPRNNVNYDVSGFKEFNPENTLGGETLNLGLEKEFLGNPSSMKTYYSNDAYIPDEVAGTSRVQQQHWDNQEGSSSGSSSDAEDDGPSLPPLSQNHDLARRQLQERLATIQASDSEEDNDSDQDVLFNRNPGTTAQLNASVVPVDVHSYMDHEGETIL
ncbi:unnamed protein product [Meganyctiphanes norvegica]|uniref:Uncharacterized protein n=1 Tax=Meganyctiphanes norvegica TaxID=48144 RepID=A0AAV2PMB5_MEGNR